MKNLFYSLSFILLFSGSALAQLSGERTVPSDDYPDLKTIADSLNLYGVGSGGINFMVLGGSTFSELPIDFTATGNADDAVYLGWDGAGEKPTVNFEGTEADGEAGFTLTGVDYYTIDGLAITNTNSNLEVGVLIVNLDDQNGAHNNTIKNVEITLDKLNVNQTSGIVVNAQIPPVSADGNNHNNKFYNNSISNATIGYTLDGNTYDTPLMAVGNEINTQDEGESIISDVVLAGVTAKDQNGFNISNTTIRDLTRIGTGTTAPAAISTSSGNPTEPLTNEFIIANNTIEDLTSSFTSIFGMYLSARKVTYHINNNKIDNVTATGGGGNTADGIMLLATDAIANIYNNMISGIAAPESAVNNNAATRGINLRTYAQGNVFYNTVLLDYEATNPANTSSALMIYNNSDPVQMRNNIFINKTVLPADATGKVTAVYKRNNAFTGIMEGTDNNIYYAGVPGPQNVIYYGHNASTPNVHETLESYQAAAITFDQNSYTEDVEFVASDDLHILASANSVAQNNAMPVTEPIEVTTDFDGNLRDTDTPDIGADEIAGPTLGPLTGVRTVPSADYTDLKTIADSLNLYGVGPGGVSFMIQGGSTFAELPIEFLGTGNSDDPVYIGWDGVGEMPSVNFEGTVADGEAGFKLTGVDNYTIEGMKITNSNSNIEFGILIANLDDQNGAHNNTVKNVEIILDKLNENQTSGIVVSALIEPTVFEGNNHNNKFYNNSISNTTIGYTFDGGTYTTPLMAVGNEVGIEGDGESTIFDVVLAGVTAKDQNGFNFSNTSIYNITRIGDGNTAPAAISTSSGNPTEPLTNEFIISNNTIEDMTSSFTSIFGMYISARKATYQINNNKINNVTATGGDNTTADGILVLASDVVVNIYNNMISGIAAPASSVSGNNVVTRGIAVRTYALANIFYNTIVLDYTATNPANKSAALSIFHNSDPVLLRNNIFINKTILPENADGMVAAVHKKNNTLIGLVEGTDNNIYYAGVPGPQNAIFYGFHSSAPLLLETLEDYQTAAATFDQNSYTEDVPFVASDDLHVVASANSVAKNNAMPVTDPIVITTDFDGTTRDTDTPDIGADEIASPSTLFAVNPNPEDGETGVEVGLAEFSWDYFTNIEFTNPVEFKVYLSESPIIVDESLFATVMWEEGVTHYSVINPGLDAATDYYWKVVPTADPGDFSTPDGVVIWTFQTDIYAYPNTAINPSPADGAVITLTDDHILTFGWDYNPLATHSLPAYFEIYGSADILSTEWQTPIATINYVEGQVAYQIELTNNPNFTYEELFNNFWKIVPVSADDNAAPDVQVWEFFFDETIGLNNLSLEGTTIYPNPAVDVLNIEPGFEGKYEVILYDVQGRQVQHFGEGEGLRTINISSVHSGAYQIVIKQGDAQFVNLIKVK